MKNLTFCLVLICGWSITNAQQWSTSGTNIYNNNTGNVGIGTTSPQSKLEIVDGSLTIKSDPYAEIGVERTNGGRVAVGVTSGSLEGFLGSRGHLKFITNGESIPKMFIKDNGKIGIGTTNPQSKLEIIDGSLMIKSDPYAHIGIERTNGGRVTMGVTSGSLEGFVSSAGHLKFLTLGDPVPKMFIKDNGDIGIGTTTPDAKLTVKGDIHTREVRVDLNGATGPDFVFEKDYDLRSLEETEAFIKNHKHLPEIPSAAEMEENGIELKEMNLKLLQKVEELTLHLIEQGKKIKDILQENENLRTKILEIENAKY